MSNGKKHPKGIFDDTLNSIIYLSDFCQFCTNGTITIECICRGKGIHMAKSGQLSVNISQVYENIPNNFGLNLIHCNIFINLQKNWHPYTTEQLDLASSNKTDMLEFAHTCYTKAAALADGEEAEEQWLHHYMLGKIAEKQHKDIQVYLEHYKQVIYTFYYMYGTSAYYITLLVCSMEYNTVVVDMKFIC